MSGFPPRVRAVLGPTNTGKTHLAIERMLSHDSGIIGFPLRLLARENYDRMVARKGAARVALITGEEKIVPPGARWFSCTVEAMPLDRETGASPAPGVHGAHSSSFHEMRGAHSSSFHEMRGAHSSSFHEMRGAHSSSFHEMRGAHSSSFHEMRGAHFVAVDEIQLCADPDRGHVFTDRLLHARGLAETMFLGAETIRPLLRRLVPQAEVETRPRLSQLSHAGPAKLTRLPPRSAVVAFSAGEVYAIAEMIRRRRGGCAVVMGRLSPRTRNAQVALYQEKEVDFLVATDAIGMGLNMDVDHVAFAGLAKFDGHRPRRLTAPELAQIAGRAGRGMRDGTFGTTGPCPPLAEDLVEAVETHEFEALEQLFWRNSALDDASVEALLASLTAPPPRAGLVRGNDASDLETLTALAQDPEIRDMARGRRMVRTLWEACQIPDFRKLADDTHLQLCARVFRHLAREGRLPTDWLAGQIGAVARADGDIDTLMQRLAGVRIWSYIAARSDWVRDAAHWQARAREAEDLLSDALHERLTARFVDRRAAHLIRRLDAAEGETLLSAVTARGEVVVEGHAVGHVAAFGFHPDPLAEGEERRLVLRAARRALRQEMPRRVERLEQAADDAFRCDEQHRVFWDGAPVARLRPGPSLRAPRIAVLDSEFLDGPQRERVRVRLQRWLNEMVAQGLAPLLAAEARAASDPVLRGLVHRLAEAGGVVPGATEAEISPAMRGRLKPVGARAGRFALYVPALLKPAAMALRARLWALRHGAALPGLPPPSAIALPLARDWPDGFAAALGWVEAGPVLLRLDIAERIAGILAHATRRGAAPLPPGLATRLGVAPAVLPAVLRGLGWRTLPAPGLAPGAFGPPAPPMLAPLRRRGDRGRPDGPGAAAADGPFAALAALRR